MPDSIELVLGFIVTMVILAVAYTILWALYSILRSLVEGARRRRTAERFWAKNGDAILDAVERAEIEDLEE